MKNFKIFGMALLCAVLSLTFSACSDDDEDDKGGSTSTLAGTWVITNYYDPDPDDDGITPIGNTLTFYYDYTMRVSSYPDQTRFPYTLRGNTLRITFDDETEEYMEGELSISGNTAVWTFRDHDEDGFDDGEDYVYVMTMEKQ